jgi:hypothetical protein
LESKGKKLMGFLYSNSTSTSVKNTSTLAKNALGRIANAGTAAMANQIANEAHKIEDKYADKVQAAQKNAADHNKQAPLAIGAFALVAILYFASRR